MAAISYIFLAVFFVSLAVALFKKERKAIPVIYGSGLSFLLSLAGTDTLVDLLHIFAWLGVIVLAIVINGALLVALSQKIKDWRGSRAENCP